MRITILGNNLTARHFVKHLANSHQTFQIALWTYDDVAYPEFENVASCLRFHGIKNLPNALLAADVVVNLHECTDFSMLPDVKKLQLHNVEVVRSLLFHSKAPLIHLSSPFLQCSNRWPNVYEPERDPMAFKAQWPFPEYCASKLEAETLVKEASNDCYIVRCVPTYGEGDETSILTDLIYFSNDGLSWKLGDGDGHMQMAYVGNVSVALWSAVGRLLSQSTSLDLNKSFEEELGDLTSYDDQSTIKCHDETTLKYYQTPNRKHMAFDVEEEDEDDDDDSLPEDSFEFYPLEAKRGFTSFCTEPSFAEETSEQRIFEIFLINDDTPKKTVFDTYDQLLYSSKSARSVAQIPFIPLYYMYLLFAMVVQFAIKVLGPLKFAAMLPNPSFLYFYFHDWTFFNATKSLLMLGYKPEFDFKECIDQCAQYYRGMSKKDVRRFSWQNSMPCTPTQH